MFTKIRKTEGWGTRNSGGGRTVRTAEHSGGTHAYCTRKSCRATSTLYFPSQNMTDIFFTSCRGASLLPGVCTLFCPRRLPDDAGAHTGRPRHAPTVPFGRGEVHPGTAPTQGKSQTFGNVVHEIRNIRCCCRSISFDLQAAGNDFSPGIPGMRFYDLHSTAKMFIG